MSKIFLIGDIHISLGYPNSVDKWYNVHQEYFSKFLIPLLKREVKEGDIIVQLGDFFDNRDIIPINLINYAMDIIEEISKIAPLHIIVGNHDLYSKSASKLNSVRPFRYIPNVSVYDTPQIIEYDGLKILMMPYIENRLDQINIIRENKNCDYLFCHSDLNGCKMHFSSVAKRNNDKIDIEDFKFFKRVYSGHIHLVQVNKNFTFVGSIFQMDRNDINDEKGIFVINTENGSEEFFANKISPIFRKFEILSEKDIDSLDEIKETKDYIDLSISNSLLVSNRKLRRKLESLLEKGKFSSIEYINDITESLLEDKEDNIIDAISNNNTEISYKNSELEEYVKEYVDKQTYNNENFKKGVLIELDEITKIFKENYKNNLDI